MANIGGINPVCGPDPIQPNNAPAGPSRPEAPHPQPDTVEISERAKFAGKLAQVPDVRADLIARVKAEIAAGTYETPEKLDAAVNALIEEL